MKYILTQEELEKYIQLEKAAEKNQFTLGYGKTYMSVTKDEVVSALIDELTRLKVSYSELSTENREMEKQLEKKSRKWFS